MHEEQHIPNFLLEVILNRTNQLTDAVNTWLAEGQNNSEQLIQTVMEYLEKKQSASSALLSLEASILLEENLLYSLNSYEGPLCYQVFMMLLAQYEMLQAVTRELKITHMPESNQHGESYSAYDRWLCEAVSRFINKDILEACFDENMPQPRNKTIVKKMGNIQQRYEFYKSIIDAYTEQYSNECSVCRELLLLMGK